MTCKCISKKKRNVTLWTIISVLTVSVIMLVVFSPIFEGILKREINLQKGTVASRFWSDIPIPIYERLYFFNITNKQEFLRGVEPLNVSEIGPYTYEVTLVRNNLRWNSNNTLSYSDTYLFHFVPHLSNGSEDDVIHTLNGPLIIASKLSKDFNDAMKSMLLVLVSSVGEDIVIERSIKQLAHSGYKDKIIQIAPIFIPTIPLRDGLFYWLFDFNNTFEVFTAFTGADNPAKTALINKWNYQSKLNFWNGDTCNMISGTGLVLGPPVKYYGNSYTFFHKLFCRSLTYSYSEDKTHFGVQVKRFVLTHDLFANSTENPNNYCFEVNGERPSGVLELSSCKFGAPVYLSNPHFYFADTAYLNNINGLSPKQADHGSHIDVEIISGFSIYAKVRFQFNVEINKTGGIIETHDVADGLYPIFWIEISLEVDEPTASLIKRKTKYPKIIAYSVFGTLTTIGSILVMICCGILCMQRFEDETHKRLLGSACKEHAKFQKSKDTFENKNMGNQEENQMMDPEYQ